jgi:hypothetical protein
MTKSSRFLDPDKFNGLPVGRYVVPLVRVNGHDTDIGQGQVIPNKFIEPPNLTFDIATGILTIGGRSIDLGEQDRFYVDCRAAAIASMTPLVTCSNLSEIIDATVAGLSGLKLQTPGNIFSGIQIRLGTNEAGPSGLSINNTGLVLHPQDAFNLIKEFTDVAYITGAQAVLLIQNLAPGLVNTELTNRFTAGANMSIVFAPGGEIVFSSSAPSGTVSSNTLVPVPRTYISDAGDGGSKLNILSSVNGVQAELTSEQLGDILKLNTQAFALAGIPLFVLNTNPIANPSQQIIFIGQARSVYTFGSGNALGPFVENLAWGKVVTGLGNVEDGTGPFTLGNGIITAVSHPTLYAALMNPSIVAMYRNQLLTRVAYLVRVNTADAIVYQPVPVARNTYAAAPDTLL